MSIYKELNKHMIVMLTKSLTDLLYEKITTNKMLQLIDKLPDDLDVQLDNPADFDFHEYFFSDKINEDAPKVQDMFILDDEISLEILFKCNPVHKNYIDGNILHLGKMIKENVPVKLIENLEDIKERITTFRSYLSQTMELHQAAA